MRTNKVVRKVREADILILKAIHYLSVAAGLALLVSWNQEPLLPVNAVAGLAVFVMAFELKEIVDTYTLERSRAEAQDEARDVAHPSGEYALDPDEGQPTIQRG